MPLATHLLSESGPASQSDLDVMTDSTATSSWTVQRVDVEPPPALDDGPYPCVHCGRFSARHDVRRAEVIRDVDGHTRTVLLCIECAPQVRLPLGF